MPRIILITLLQLKLLHCPFYGCPTADDIPHGMVFTHECDTADIQKQTEKRVALVIGNANYAKGALRCPVWDAQLVEKTLKSLGFDVFLGLDLATSDEMITLIKKFSKARANYDVAFVYYAGHGIQIESENFLLPTQEFFDDATTADCEEIAFDIPAETGNLLWKYSLHLT